MAIGSLIIFDGFVERREGLVVESQSRAVVQGPAAERQQGPRGVVRGHERGGGADLVIAKAGADGGFGRQGPNFLADPAVDRRWRDRILHVPVGTFMLQADWRPHETGASGESELAATHRLEGEIGLAQSALGTLASLDRTDDRGPQRPGA